MTAKTALLAASALLVAAPSQAVRYAQGERIQVTGIVSDAEGKPLEGIRVVFEASRNTFDVRQLRRTSKDVRRLAATTDAKGTYTIDWIWDAYFNHFELAAGVMVRRAKVGETLEELDRSNITRQVGSGSPVVAAVVIHNRRVIDRFRDFLASVKSADEQRVYQEMGKPDRVERVQYPGSVEVSWWYFEAGRAYRFRDGRLEQVVPFDPVRGFGTQVQ
jgi:hypothetical protein